MIDFFVTPLSCSMQLLIIAATGAEIGPFMASPAAQKADVLITGAGMVAATYALTRRLAERRYDLVVQAGIGGSFDPALKPGDVVRITSDCFGDMGAEDHEHFLDINELGFETGHGQLFKESRLVAPTLPNVAVELPGTTGLTVNTVSGNTPTIMRRAEKYGCQVESMEGAAFHFVCLSEDVPFVQVRAISNYVTPRDKSQWQMKEAIINLNKWLVAFVEGYYARAQKRKD